MEHLATQISAAVTMRTLYPPNHPRVIHSVDGAVAALRRLVAQNRSDSVTYVLIGDDLVVGDEVIRKTTLPVREFIGILKRRGIQRLTLAADLDADELRPFIDALAGDGTLASSRYITIGQAHVVMDERPKEDEHYPPTVEQIEIAREAWARFRVERKLPVDQLEELVWSLIDSVARTTRSMLPLAKLKEHDEYTFVHSVNVSLLVLAQARCFGLWGPTLHAFGMAGLLHDIGKLNIPVEILNKPGKLEGAEWETMKTHAQHGAWYLSEIDGVTPLSAVVAFEHHMRYDQQPAYPRLQTPRMPSLASRMTTIADTFDAMSTVRPYQQPLGRAAAIALLKKRAGTFYDPQLVSNFVRLVGENEAVATASSVS